MRLAAVNAIGHPFVSLPDQSQLLFKILITWESGNRLEFVETNNYPDFLLPGYCFGQVEYLITLLFNFFPVKTDRETVMVLVSYSVMNLSE